MGWIITYDAPKGLRTHRGFWSVTTNNMWFIPELGKWVSGDSTGGMDMSTHHTKPKTLKAFLRYLNKHPELKGSTVTLVNNYYIRTKGVTYELHVSANWSDKE